jgi:molybdopterin-binding protein
MRRIKDNWLKEYLRYTEWQESPKTFHLWVGLSMIASSLERNVFIDMAYYTIFPNLYIILVADSAVCRKSTAIKIGTKLLKQIEDPPFLFSQKITPEALIGSLVNQCRIDTQTGEVIKNATALVAVDELSIFLGKEAYSSGLIAILTSLYDCSDEWEYETRSRGPEVAYNTCINMIAASTPEWLRLAIPPDAVGGGFTSRINFVYQSFSDKINPLPILHPEHHKMKENLIHDLSLIRRLSGPFAMTKEAREWYIEWYTSHRKEMLEKEDKDGSGERVVRTEDILLKLSMCFSVAENDNMIITLEHFESALRALMENDKHMPETLRMLASSSLGLDANKVMNIIKKAPVGIAHSNLQQKVYHLLDSKRLKEVLDTLLEAQFIELNTNTKGGIVYNYVNPQKTKIYKKKRTDVPPVEEDTPFDKPVT